MDGVASIQQSPTGFVDVLHPIGEVAEIAPAGVAMFVPIVGQLDHWRVGLFGPRDIIRRTDLATGTFYNYFASRDEVIDAVILDAVESLGQRLDALTANMTDAAEIYSFSTRHLMRTAVSDPVWGWLVVRLGIAQDGLLSALGPRASRDLQIGVDSGRFKIDDVSIASAMTWAICSAGAARFSSEPSPL